MSDINSNSSTLKLTGTLTTANGILTGQLAVGNSSLDTSSVVAISDGSVLTGTTQNALRTTSTFNSSATTAAYGVRSSPQTAAASFTVASMAGFYANAPVVGSGSTITRFINYLTEISTGATNNAAVADNITFTGNYFLNQNSSTTLNKLNGGVGIGGDPSAASPIFIQKDQNAQSSITIRNFNTSSSSAAALQLSSAYGTVNMVSFAAASGLGAAFRLQSSSSHTAGIIIDAAGTNPMELRTNNTAAINISSTQNITISTGDLKINTAGKGLFVKEGSNAKMGTAVLSGGTVTVSTTAVTASSRIFLTINTVGGTPGAVYVSARTAATSFDITSTSGTDTSTVAWMIVEPA